MKKTVSVLLVLPLLLAVAVNWLWAEELVSEEESNAADKEAFASTLTAQDRDVLIDLARKAISQYLESGSRMELSLERRTPGLLEKKGCFVTLMMQGTLRGCIGHILPQECLCDCVVLNAINAAAHDQRFMPVSTQRELDALNIEISVLSIPERLEAANADDVLKVLMPGRDGVILKQGWHQATYLPQVWEHFPEKKSFLRSLCRKGGMAPDCWADPNTEVYRYRVEVIREKER